MDQNNPARFLDTAYNALKANPGATNQILQAAAQGQPVGLRGLAAAAAQQSQQEAQKTMAALQQQGPQPNIVQKLATQGIMSQMDTGLPIAPQMGAPEEMPQQMLAGGGLVAFAGGGNVLPPDVIDAIQSHFAEGGDVRGFAGGKEIMAILRGAEESLPYGEMGSFIEGPGAIPRSMPADYGPMGSFIEGAPRKAPSKLDLLKKFLGKEISPAEIEAGIASKVKAGAGKGLDAISKYGKAVGALGKVAGPVGYATSLYDVGNIIADPKNREAFTEDWRREMPTWLGGRGEQPEIPKATESTPDDLIDVADMDGRSARAEPLKDDRGNKIPAPSVRKPDATLTSHESTVKSDIIEEGKKADKVFDQAANTQAEGLGGLDQGKETVDYLKGLLGEKKMDPEIAKKLGDLESGARTSTILQSVLGGLAGGLSNPYGGRFALGSAALNALGGYQKGIASEEDIQRKALDIERAYADQPAETQQAAAKMYIDLLGDKAKLQSAERVAEGKAESAWDRLMQSEEGKLLRAQIMAGQKGDVTEGQKLTAWNQAREQAAKEVKDEYVGTTPPEGELERRTQKHYMAALNSILAATGGLGAGQAQQQQYGLGAAPTGRSIIGGKLTGSSPQQ